MSRISATRISGWIAIVIPPVAFYVLLFRSVTKLPYADDYDSILAFLLQWRTESRLQHIVQIITAQHNEYRLMFENAIFGIQYAILGHTNLEFIAILGDLFVIPVVVALYLIWRNFGHTGDFALLGFVPASWMVFQLQYASTLNFPMNALQSVPVIMFMLLACWLATRPGRGAFVGSLLSLLFCIASSSNGLFLIPIGCLMFLQRKQYSRLMAWLATGAAMAVVYFIGYNFHASSTHADHNLLSSVRHISLAYGAAFLGSIATKQNPAPAIALCILLLVIFIFATRDRLYERNPALYYACLFFFVTGLAVSGLRSEGGLVTALGSRYRLNSSTLATLLYFYLVDKFHGYRMKRPVFVGAMCLMALVLVVFTFESDRGGESLLMVRRAKLRNAMLRWERHEPRAPVVAYGPDDLTLRADKQGYYEPKSDILTASIQAGIYTLPDPLD